MCVFAGGLPIALHVSTLAVIDSSDSRRSFCKKLNARWWQQDEMMLDQHRVRPGSGCDELYVGGELYVGPYLRQCNHTDVMLRFVPKL